MAHSQETIEKEVKVTHVSQTEAYDIFRVTTVSFDDYVRHPRGSYTIEEIENQFTDH